MKYKVAYRGDGTKETGKKIIAELERLGGVNYYCHHGNNDGYYWIDKVDNRICCTSYLPKACTLTQLESTKKLFRLL